MKATSTRTDLWTRAQSVAKNVAAAHADDVDRGGRFPKETIDALREAKLLSSAVPSDLGGHGCTMQELAAQCQAIAQACGSSGMVLAMHHIQVACIARHGLESPFFRQYLTELVEKQLLIASVTSEVGVWGDTRSSICAVERDGDRFKLDKDATTISYGAHADDLLVTSRRGPDAAQSDQVLVLLRKGDFKLEQTTTWDTLGMRGTSSPGFKLTSTGPVEQVVPGSFADASAVTMVPYSHILWSAVWLGIASDAVARAASFVRAAARKTPGKVPASATRLAEVSTQLQVMRSQVAAAAAEFDAAATEDLHTIGWALKMNQLKISSSEMAPVIIQEALRVIGIVGFKNDSSYSVGRHLRDTLSAALMISNDRILEKSASMLLVFKDM